MTDRIVKRVVVAGGGTAGWVTATALVRHLGPLIDVTLVESDAISTIGVGESTVPTFKSFHKLMGIKEDVFMSAAQATIKLGIEFENWGRIGDRYIHPFGTIGRRWSWMADFHHFWLHARARGFGGDLNDYCLEYVAGEANRMSLSPPVAPSYAYHIDAASYTRFLRGLAEPAGVTRVEGKIRHVALHPESGFIDAIELDSGQRIEADLFIDCTGFRSLLLGQALGVAFEDWGRWITTDRAVAVQSRSVHPPRPYTSAIAHEAGWRWRIPLQHREGNGFVFNSQSMSDDEAQARLMAEIDGEPTVDPWLVRFQTGMRVQSWARNCVGLGLAGGFIEPLESTSIHLMMAAVTRLIEDFPFNGCTDALINNFNAKSRQEFENIRDFIILHYHITEREDSSFWRHCRTMELPHSLQERLALWREDARAYQLPHELFRVDSWASVLLGQGYEPRGYHRLAEMMPEEKLRSELASMRTQIAELVEGMASHPDFLKAYCPAEEPAFARAHPAELALSG
ncbi:tryptophan halogenase family protein [Sphingomonas sp. PR090111-T3T-6A]|uniref:tryptophan halogenase family protein n=1 Tax=Sphingomonas sp. PR090111-T3T-6A TaxID=685778 RepID=UPI00036F1611|nr:tryptophan halogenase family protein [Sphingomonas sp. PR090111-T3T-6A]